VLPYGTDPGWGGRQRDVLAAALVLMLALSTPFLSDESQGRVAAGIQRSALRPFIGVQRRLEDARVRAVQVDSMLGLVDSLSAMLSTHSALVDENRTLRELLDLSGRTAPTYLPATLLRPGTPGAASMFIVDVGSDDGVRVGSPVVAPFGLVGVVREVRDRESVGIDWTHPDFRASAMMADGSAFGLIENRPGRFREEDRLILNGIPFNEQIEPEGVVVTSGLGGVLPRGIPIGRIDGIADTQGEWRKSYWLDAMVDPGAATHVLVIAGESALVAPEAWPEGRVDSARAFDRDEPRDRGGPGG
jgi:rod shape-determining protein MreC